MKFKVFTPLLFLLATSCHAQDKCSIKVAVIDTGLNLNDARFTGHLCETGHKNFVANEPIDDLHSHGTHITGLIQKYAKDANYCLLIYKYYREGDRGSLNMSREVLALKEAIRNGATIVNYSGGGDEFNEEEYLTIKDNPQVTFVVAAGNESQNLDIPGNEFYPASLFLKNVVVVGNIDDRGNKSPHSNWSKKIKVKEVGMDVRSTVPCNTFEGEDKCNDTMSGTSQSTAIYTGKLINKLSKTCNNRGK